MRENNGRAASRPSAVLANDVQQVATWLECGGGEFVGLAAGFLQEQEVRLVAFQEAQHMGRALADRIDVEGRQFHARRSGNGKGSAAATGADRLRVLHAEMRADEGVVPVQLGPRQQAQ